MHSNLILIVVTLTMNSEPTLPQKTAVHLNDKLVDAEQHTIHH